ncbi:MAG: sigma-70 family RNA polymerase sigma factor, partial [Leptolyngbyaceae bacterium]|nr:sigma-70 family RNA polymerase sigma factor [Leptolyngbyaceae bacterium]
MQVPQFPECQHLLVTALSEKTDQELVSLFQMHPTQGKYFVALFCRYSADIYTLIQKDVRSPVQGEYLFSMVWKQIHHELQHLDV